MINQYALALYIFAARTAFSLNQQDKFLGMCESIARRGLISLNSMAASCGLAAIVGGIVMNVQMFAIFQNMPNGKFVIYCNIKVQVGYFVTYILKFAIKELKILMLSTE